MKCFDFRGTSLIFRAALLCGSLAFAAGCSDSKSVSGSTGGSGNAGGGASSGGSVSSGGSGETGDTTSHTYDHADEGIVYSGRILFADGKAPRFSAPAVTISARFKGVSAAMTVSYPSGGSNYFDAVIDDDFANPKKITPADGDATELFTGLPYGEHKISVIRRTEANTGQVDFESFTFGGVILPPPARPTRRIEIIGDSISAGSGDEGMDGTATCPSDTRPYSNASKAYGPVLARALNAEYQVTAVSGIGITRNYNCKDLGTMPKVYDRVFLESASSPTWDPASFVPDAVMMLIGTNDFSPGEPVNCHQIALSEQVDPENYALFISSLEDFIGVVRGYYPDAEIFLAASPMLHDGWPDATFTSNTSQRAAITTVADELNAKDAGPAKIHTLLADFSKTKIVGRGCGTHPSAYEHGIMAGFDVSRPNDTVPATLFLDPIKEVMGW